MSTEESKPNGKQTLVDWEDEYFDEMLSVLGTLRAAGVIVGDGNIRTACRAWCLVLRGHIPAEELELAVMSGVARKCERKQEDYSKFFSASDVLSYWFEYKRELRIANYEALVKSKPCSFYPCDNCNDTGFLTYFDQGMKQETTIPCRMNGKRRPRPSFYFDEVE